MRSAHIGIALIHAGNTVSVADVVPKSTWMNADLSFSSADSAAGIASSIQDVLTGLLRLNSCTSDKATGTALLNILTPGMYGCATMPRGSDAVRPQQTILDATLAILSSAPEQLQSLLPAVLENCIMRAPDKAPPRTTLASACASIFTMFGNYVPARLLHFLAVATLSPSQSLRSLALQCMEAMVLHALDSAAPEVRSLYNAASNLCLQPLPASGRLCFPFVAARCRSSCSCFLHQQY